MHGGSQTQTSESHRTHDPPRVTKLSMGSLGRVWKRDFEIDEYLKSVLYISKQILLEDS